ncbi:methyltransferase domain-containing protein (plasmid) [Streptomyces sp. NBC_00853]|uniref:class I SAM-dependent methyltransferase n=1 Tax=Streptomyces sp. NBC_00853 TaxID=2903681 RepID=UPI002F9146A7|nr:methyltransferase domain-containing protein [Streptomyces sp. NBC_00853]
MKQDVHSTTGYTTADGIFASCGAPYVIYRRPHPPAVVDYIAGQFGSATAQPRILDLGCGPGTLALDLAERGASVTAVDISEEMLAAGRDWAHARGVRSLTWCRADATEAAVLTKDTGLFDGATVADAFHWMDRPHVLAALDRAIRPGGFVAVVGYRAPGTQREWWHPLLEQLRLRWLGSVNLAGPATAYVEPAGGHEEVIRRSAFSQVSVLRADYRRTYTLDELVGLQRTYAYSSAATLGDRQGAFEEDMRRTLTAARPDGVFEADLQAAVIVGRRPTAAAG